MRLPANDRADPVIQCARPDCSELFVPRDDAHNHCSRRCYTIMWARTHAVRKHKRARLCKVCDDLFLSIRGSHATRSPACYRVIRKWREVG